ncbi:hypothetical protein PG989_004356 [Apiospora arundinis]
MARFFGSKKSPPPNPPKFSSARPNNPAQPGLNSEISGLRIIEESDATGSTRPATTEVDKDSITFRAVTTCINLGLRLLESPQGKAALVSIGQGVVSNRAKFEHIYEDNPQNMPWWVELFLARLRASFPSALLTNRLAGEGATLRANWGQGGVKMRQWDPKDAGNLKLNKLIIYHLIRAGRKSAQNEQPRDAHVCAYERFLFLMGITVAHELVHFFVGFLTGYDAPSTPGEVSFLPSIYNIPIAGGRYVGESGRAWEGVVFGGIVETIENRSSPLGVYQSGDLYLIDANETVRKVDHASVKRILALCKFRLITPLRKHTLMAGEDMDFPLRTTGANIALDTLILTARRMSSVRAEILPPGLIPTSPRDRRGPGVISSENLRSLTRLAPHTVRGREFAILGHVLREPSYLFVAA